MAAGLGRPAIQHGRQEYLGLPGVAHVRVGARVEPGRAAAQSSRLAQPHLALEYTARLGVELVHLQLVLILDYQHRHHTALHLQLDLPGNSSSA